MTRNAEDRVLDHWVHWSLLAGLVVCGLLLISGLGLSLARGQAAPEGPPPGLGRLMDEAARGNGPSLILLGLLVLLGTPVVRVIVLAVGWFWLGDRRFALVAGAVLALLAVGVVLGVG